MRIRGMLLAGIVGMFALSGALAASVSAGPGPKDRRCGTTPPVYELATFNRVPCARADDVSFGLANRFDRPSDFRDREEGKVFVQRDDKGKKWRCRWQSADIRNNSVLWACGRGKGVITWAWRNPDDGVEPPEGP